jgi:hypothetical protein
VIITRVVADVPDESLVAPCDTRDPPWTLGGELIEALGVTKRQRNDCADQVAALARHRAEALERARIANEEAAKASE